MCDTYITNNANKYVENRKENNRYANTKNTVQLCRQMIQVGKN